MLESAIKRGFVVAFTTRLNAVTFERQQVYKMAYIKKEIKAGRTIEIIKYYDHSHHPKDIKRERIKKDPERIEKENISKATKKLTRILNNNFVDGDIYATLTYKKTKGTTTKSLKEVEKDIKQVINRLRGIYKKNNQSLKYVYVTSLGEGGKTPHAHIVINGLDCDYQKTIGLLSDLWLAKEYRGRIKPQSLYSNGQYKELAAYIIKNGLEKRRAKESGGKNKRLWTCSQNLEKPKEVKTVIKAIRYGQRSPQPPKGYYLDLDTYKSGYTAAGYPYITYTFIKAPEREYIKGYRPQKDKEGGYSK